MWHYIVHDEVYFGRVWMGVRLGVKGCLCCFVVFYSLCLFIVAKFITFVSKIIINHYEGIEIRGNLCG